MAESLIIAVGGIVGLTIIWVGVQMVWGQLFSEYLDDDDVLAGRTNCSNCGCTTICEKKIQQTK